MEYNKTRKQIDKYRDIKTIGQQKVVSRDPWTHEDNQIQKISWIKQEILIHTLHS